MCRTIAGGTDILTWTSTTSDTWHGTIPIHKFIMTFQRHHPFLVLSCNCVCPVGAPGRPATGWWGVAVEYQSVYLNACAHTLLPPPMREACMISKNRNVSDTLIPFSARGGVDSQLASSRLDQAGTNSSRLDHVTGPWADIQ